MSDTYFKTLNGHKVKDEEARQQLAEMELAKASHMDVEEVQTELQGNIDTLGTQVDELETRFNMATITGNATNITYDNSKTGITASDAQSAIDEVHAIATSVQQGTAQGTTYDNSVSGLDATDVQGAIDEVKAETDALNESLALNIGFLNPAKNLAQIASESGVTAYTATEDCWAVGYVRATSAGTGYIDLIDGEYSVRIYTTSDTSNAVRHVYPVKSGQAFSVPRGDFDFIFYGMY